MQHAAKPISRNLFAVERNVELGHMETHISRTGSLQSNYDSEGDMWLKMSSLFGMASEPSK
ncbi:hypothetical protein WN943_022885 [Citrus x changshan-huyou]